MALNMKFWSKLAYIYQGDGTSTPPPYIPGMTLAVE